MPPTHAFRPSIAPEICHVCHRDRDDPRHDTDPETGPNAFHPPFVQTVERDSIVERRTEVMGAWPEDSRTQRAWAIDRALASTSHALASAEIEDLIERADAILTYVNAEYTP